MHRKPILIDLDEVVYPFIHTWDKWLKDEKGLGVDWDAFVWHYDLDLYLSNHVEKQPEFVSAAPGLDPQPIQEAVHALQLLSEDYPIMALTARNSEDWHGATHDWIGRHLPFVKDIHFARHGRGEAATPKGVIADQLKAKALIDDTAFWIETLPSHIDGFVLKRPAPLASDEGAVSWDYILNQLAAERKAA